MHDFEYTDYRVAAAQNLIDCPMRLIDWLDNMDRRIDILSKNVSILVHLITAKPPIADEVPMEECLLRSEEASATAMGLALLDPQTEF